MPSTRYVPDVLDRKLVDEWVKTTDQPSFLLARRLIREEGLLVGGSSGSAMFAALQAAPRLKEGQNCVVVLPDGVRNYMTKFVDDKWMRDNGFFQTPTVPGKVQDLFGAEARRPALVAATDTDTIHEVIDSMREKGISQLPVTSGGVLVGIVTEADLMQFLGSGEGATDSLVSKCMTRHVAIVSVSSPISALEELLRKNTAVVVVDDRRCPIGILTRIDLLHYLTVHQPASA